MSQEHQPEAQWVFPEEKKSNRAGIWLIVVLSVLAVSIVGMLLFFLLPPAGGPEPTASPTATDSTTPRPTTSSTPTATSTPPPTPVATPIATPTPTSAPPAPPIPTDPPATSPDHATFVTEVTPPLNDAATGLSIVAEGGPDAAQVVGNLQQDSGRLSDTAAPEDIKSAWADAVTQYAARLADLRAAFDNGADPQPALDAASAALQNVRSIAGI